MLETLVPLLRCPVSHSPLRLEIISRTVKTFSSGDKQIVQEGLLYASSEWFYPIIDGIPRLIVEACLDYESFLRKHMPDFDMKVIELKRKHAILIKSVVQKNKRAKQSFSQEWSLFDYSKDKTWNADERQMMERFLCETNEELPNIGGMLILDAGCGNGLVDQLLARAGATVVGIDFSNSIVRAFNENKEVNAHFLQADVDYPPFQPSSFDLVYCSGVLMFMPSTEDSFSHVEALVRAGGKTSIWLYHPRKSKMHAMMRSIANLTSRLPVKVQYYLYAVSIFPVSYIVKKLKGNKQNAREIMVEILDGFSHPYRREHEHDEVAGWFRTRHYTNISITTTNVFGFNIIGIKKRTD